MNKITLSILTIAISGVAFTQVDRNAFVETFTSSTCPPCNPGNIALENLLDDTVNDGKTVSIKYQVNWPGNGDPYYTSEAGARKNVYGVVGVPETEVDGTIYNGGPSSLTQGHLNQSYGTAAKADISAYYQVDELSQTVNVQIDFEAIEAITVGARLFTAIFEYETVNNTGGNGETEFFHVMKKMVPTASGSIIFSMNPGDTDSKQESYTFAGNYRLPPDAGSPIDHNIEHSVEEFSDLGVAVWIQNPGTKEVYQAVYAIQGYDPLGVEEQDEIVSAKVYPNPTETKATIAFHSTVADNVAIEVYNNSGQLVFSEEISDVVVGRNTYVLNTENCAVGLYTVRIGNQNKRLSIQ